MREIRACVIGWPVGHSRSPLIHGHWLKMYGVRGSYTREAVRPEELAGFLDALKPRGFAGCNVTVPHKEEVFRRVLVNDEATRSIGAVNTLYMREGQICGMNTDGYGFLANMLSALPGWKAAGKTATVLGAGGAARGIVATLLQEGMSRVMVVNRTAERAEKLVRDFGSRVTPCEWAVLPEALERSDLLLNTTSLGMTGSPPLEISLEPLPRAMPVADIVYVPLETDLLRAARRRGHPVVDGLGMLLHQAVPGFEKWFGVRPQVTRELRQVLVEDLMRSRT